MKIKRVNVISVLMLMSPLYWCAVYKLFQKVTNVEQNIGLFFGSTLAVMVILIAIGFVQANGRGY